MSQLTSIQILDTAIWTELGKQEDAEPSAEDERVKQQIALVNEAVDTHPLAFAEVFEGEVLRRPSTDEHHRNLWLAPSRVSAWPGLAG